MEKYVDLLIVEGDSLYVVEVDSHEATNGDLVEFEVDGITLLGRVKAQFWCERGGEAWECVNMLQPICQAKQIYRPKRFNNEAD